MFNFCSSTSSNKDQPNKKPNTSNLLLTFNLSMVASLRVESEWFIFTEISIKIFLKTKNLFIQGKHFVFLLLWMFLLTFQLKEGTFGPSDDFSFFTSEAVTFVRWKTVDAIASITWLPHSELLAFSQITISKTQNEFTFQVTHITELDLSNRRSKTIDLQTDLPKDDLQTASPSTMVPQKPNTKSAATKSC